MSTVPPRVEGDPADSGFLARIRGGEAVEPPTYQSVADCAIAGPVDLESGESILSSSRAMALLDMDWSQECPNLSLLAFAAVPDDSLAVEEEELAVHTGLILGIAHTGRCERCRKVVEQVRRDPGLRARLRSVPADRWVRCGVVVEEGGSADPWTLMGVSGGLLVIGPGALDGHPVVAVDAAAAEPVRIHEVPLARTGSLLLVSVDPPGLEVHHNASLGSHQFSIEDEAWLLAQLAPASRASIRGTDESPTGIDLYGAVPGTDLRFVVHGTPRRGMWVVELHGLDDSVAYRAWLLWSHGKSVAIDVPAGGTDRRVRIPDPDLGGSPVALMLDRVSA